MKIQAIEVGKVQAPLRTPFRTALREVRTAEDIIIKLIADDGTIGYGGAPATEVLTGENLVSIAHAISHTFAPRLLGMDIENRVGILQTIHQAMAHNTSAKAALDIAVHDLFCKHYHLPLYRFFGGHTAKIHSDLTISVNAPEEMAADAQKAVARGYHCLKIKVGTDAKLDVQRVRAVREAVGEDISLRLDANQGWQPKEAVRMIRTLEDKGLHVELVEQPVKAWDIDGLKIVTDNVSTDIMADEAAFSPADVLCLLSCRACDLINVKLMKAGGLAMAQQILSLAQAAGIGCMMGCMLESKVGITAAASLSAGSGAVIYNDLDAADLMASDPVQGGIRYEKDTLILPEEAGLGIINIEGWRPFSA